MIVGAATVGDLFDFSSCVTWIAQDQSNEKKLAAGDEPTKEKNFEAAMTWRMHLRAGRPALVEVLFMATWPESRGEGEGGGGSGDGGNGDSYQP